MMLLRNSLANMADDCLAEAERRKTDIWVLAMAGQRKVVNTPKLPYTLNVLVE